MLSTLPPPVDYSFFDSSSESESDLFCPTSNDISSAAVRNGDTAVASSAVADSVVSQNIVDIVPEEDLVDTNNLVEEVVPDVTAPVEERSASPDLNETLPYEMEEHFPATGLPPCRLRLRGDPAWMQEGDFEVYGVGKKGEKGKKLGR